jgi:CDP-glucose 4,6-dehydratase
VVLGRGSLALVGVTALSAQPPRATVDPAFWRDRRVLVTGHTGFKGAWLALWLQSLGARVTGFARDVPTDPSLFELARVGEGLHAHVLGDVRDERALYEALASADPEIVIHMAAQSLVRRSFLHPRDTYATNVMGTVNVLDAVRHHAGVRVVVNVTSDKCYDNREWEWGYRESEPMGGHDPYSSSKGCAELVTDAYRRSFFSDPNGPRVASARAGNVIGGGDWAPERLLPDIVRAALAGATLRVRNPRAVRPWQHVLCPLSGYLVLAQALWDSPDHATAWNFGPSDEDARPVGWIVERMASLWPGGLSFTDEQGSGGTHPAPQPDHDPAPQPHEAHHLKLDSSRARARLSWQPVWGLGEGLDAVVEWYRRLDDHADMRAATLGQIDAFQYAALLPMSTARPS